MKNLPTNSSGDGAGCAALVLAMIFSVAHNGFKPGQSSQQHFVLFLLIYKLVIESAPVEVLKKKVLWPKACQNEKKNLVSECLQCSMFNTFPIANFFRKCLSNKKYHTLYN